MNYWFVCLPRQDLEHCIKVKKFGLSRRHVISNVAKGDSIVCCAGKGDWKIIGLGVVESDYYIDDTKVFLKEGFFPDRFDFKAEKLSENQELCLMTIIDKLSFVKNLAYWAVFFRNGIVKMSKSDWEMIGRELNTSALK